MPAFFIDRPVFAWVVALLICLGGLLAIPFLAVAQYPIVAPPSISVSTSYPGASPENLYNSVTRLIEEELNGANGILNFESTSDSLGQVEITANFVPGTDSESASIEVQNRIKRVEARLPRAVIQQGILIEEASNAVLQIITLRSTDGSLDEVGLGDFLVRNILGEIRRIPGVGRATLYSTERALRIWIDPSRLVGYNLTADDVTKAVSSQNAQVASGSIGVEPSNPRQQISAMVLVKGQFASPDEFGAIVLRSNIDGSAVRLRDVARIEVGGLSYQFTTRRNGEPAAGLTVLLAPSANALATATAVKARMEALSKFFPANIKYDISYDITPVVIASIKKVLVTLAEAVVLVFLVMLLFLQSVRYTLIPTIVVPVALLGTCAALLLCGLSINMLALFGMVLAIGILVDDAIVVVENVERIMSEEGLSPKEAPFEEINNTISTNLGSNYVNDFPNRGRMQRVVRMQADEILTYNVRNARGQLVPVSSFATARWSVGPSQIVGFNYYPSVRISGAAKPGYTSGDAIGEMERLAAQLPRGFGYDWTGQSLQEKLSGSQAPFLLMLSALLAFLVLAALYESWTIPLAVLLTVPLGILGAVAAAMLRGLPNDVYFTVSIVTIIGLAAKDGILIIEFAKALREQGQPIRDATIAACRMRFRPIVMTGLAFVFGVAPMIVASGAGAKSQQALGTSVMGGMTAVVALALLMVPVFFVSVQAAFNRQARQELRAAATAEAQSAPQQAYASPGPSLARR
jgi:multidrug efflux pump subunit AcrB